MFGVSINQIINNPELKLRVYRDYKVLCQLNRFDDEKAEIQYKKDYSWWDTYCFQSVRFFNKFGDRFPIIQTMTNWLKWWGLRNDK